MPRVTLNEAKKYKKRLSVKDVPEVISILESLEVKNYANLARAMGRDDSALRQFCLRNGIEMAAFNKKKVIRAPALVGEVFKYADKKGIRLKDIAAKLGNHTSTVGNYRRGNSACNVFTLECIAEIVGCKIVVQPITSESNHEEADPRL